MYKRGLDFAVMRDKLSKYYESIGKVASRKKLNHDTESAFFVVSSLLYNIYVYKRDCDNNKLYQEWIPLYSRILKKVIGNDYRLILDFLLNEGIIESRLNENGNESYLNAESGFSKQYRFTQRWRDKKTLVENYKHLTSLDDAYEAAYNSLDEDQKKLSDFADHLQFLDIFDWNKKHTTLVHTFKKINGQRYKVDVSGRHYYKLTNMFEFARHFITYKGQTLCSIDCANSQPLLLWDLYNSEEYIHKSGNGEDADRYKDITLNGTFYEEVKRIVSQDKKREMDAKETKKFVFTNIFFSTKRERMLRNPNMKLFIKEFPSISNTILAYKRKKDDLSFELRKRESDLWYGKIVYRILRELPGVPVFLLHDSVFTTVEHKKEVFDIVKDVFQKKFGTLPKFHIKDYGQNTREYQRDVKRYLADKRQQEGKLKKSKAKSTSKKVEIFYFEQKNLELLPKTIQMYHANAPPKKSPLALTY